MGIIENKEKLEKVKARKREIPKCADCNEKYPILFRLNDPLWLQVAGNDTKYILLCLNCTETRLGRSFELKDFDVKAPVNDLLFKGYLIRKQEKGE